MKEAGVIVAALLAAVAVLHRSPRPAAWATLGALVLTPVLLLAQIWDSSQLEPLRDRPTLFAALGAAALVAVAAAAWAMRRWPATLPVAAVVALPFRVPISSGGTTSNLLVALYLVIAAGALGWALAELRRPDDGREEEIHPARRLEWALMGFVVLYAVQALYSDDFGKALSQIAFFYVPFALLYARMRRVAWTPRLLAWCLGALCALAVVFVGVGFWEYHARELLLNPKVINGNEFASYFRVNSLFFDPNIYGRFLAMVMIAVTAVLLWSPSTRLVLAGGVLLALLWAGLVLTFSQSSFVALLAGLAVLGAIRWSRRWTAAVAAALVVAGAAIVVAAPGALHLDLGSSASADRATSGRYDLVRGGAQLFADRPAQGWGSASFSRAYRRELDESTERAVSASHTIPVTVAAEQGVPGFLAYVALVALALLTLLRRSSRSPARAAVAAAFVALLVHTMLYAAFLEDPLTWVLLGIGGALAGLPAPDGDEPATA
ncbi:MAG TPA: O-antigen ligase family protein [Solirubrobacteraceae bacterium]|nr:O-antigen ligase family protein [Solirubrobacteraceae bacterium]